jgi:hypothetical protein
VTPQQIDLVQASWKQVLPSRRPRRRCSTAGSSSSTRPLRPLFLGDMREQGRKVMAMVSYTVTALNRLECSPAVGRSAAARRLRRAPGALLHRGAALPLDPGAGTRAAFTPRCARRGSPPTACSPIRCATPRRCPPSGFACCPPKPCLRCPDGEGARVGPSGHGDALGFLELAQRRAVASPRIPFAGSRLVAAGVQRLLDLADGRGG